MSARSGAVSASSPFPPMRDHDMAGAGVIATELTGRPTRRVVISDAGYGATLLAHGLPS